MEDEPIPLPGSDAERRAHLRLAERLRDGGRAVAVETCWVRPRWELAHALHAGLGAAASVVAVGAPAVGLGLALFALLSLLLDLSGRLFLLRRLTPERATQTVVAPDPRGPGAPGSAVASPSAAALDAPAAGTAPGSAVASPSAARAALDAPAAGTAPGAAADARSSRVRLLLTAHVDAPRGGLRHRLARLRVGPPFLWVAVALLAVAACAAARLAGDGGETAVGLVQLAPTLVLLAAVGLLVDSALATPLPPDRRPADALIAAVGALDAAPPRNVAVDVVIAGAGEGQAVGFLAHLRRRLAHAGADAPAPTSRRALARLGGRAGTGAGADDRAPSGGRALARLGGRAGAGARRVRAARAGERRAEREAIAVVELTATDGPPRWLMSDAALLPLAYHPRLVSLAAAAANEERALGPGPARGGRVVGAALRARQRRLPAIRLAAPDETSAVALLLTFVELLDAQLERG
ncbi:hypothetical protein [Conexibacter arvalis]|uniref:Uncharacterized protein n=1 Tax=Conexibacter arvalis TaxID=912552 RepID=A0A840IIE1_9ACTN|nr:hypothetical protein [Conexibacter arvalis]MBB4664095.1 hypothetical protein [Conexibacter arvalis]